MKFLGFELKPLSIDDGPFLGSFFRHHPQLLSGYTFGALLDWNPVYRYAWCSLPPDGLLISYLDPFTQEQHLLQPIGGIDGDLLSRIAWEARNLPYPLRFVGVQKGFVDHQPVIREAFMVREDRDNANYYYKSASLAHLRGREYAAKRNLIAQAQRQYGWSLEPLLPEHGPACLDLARRRVDTLPELQRTSAELELEALAVALRHLKETGQEGLLVTVDHEVTAFSIWEEQTPEVAVIHFEAASRGYKGMYQVINMETARTIERKGYSMINREEDMGIPGLRQAKLSYLPERLEPAWELILRA